MQDFNFDDLLNDEEDVLDVEEGKVVDDVVEVEEVANDSLFDRPTPADLEKEEPKVVEEPKVEPKPKATPKKKAEPTPTPQVVAQPKQTKREVATNDMNVIIAQRTLTKIAELSAIDNQELSEKEKSFAVDIALASNKAIVSQGYDWKQIDLMNNNYFGDIKKWARLGLDATTDHLYPELRKNSKTGMVDIKIKAQYQTIQKLIVKYCSKKVVSFHEDVVCKNDTLIKKFDFKTGKERIDDHVYGDKRYPNQLDDIIGAYAVAFVEEKDGSISQLVTYIDKNRINRAFNSAQTKNVWNNDTRKMVIKTAYWEMWNSPNIRAFMKFDDDIINDLSVVNDSSDVDFSNKERKHADIEGAQNEALATFGSGEKIEF